MPAPTPNSLGHVFVRPAVAAVLEQHSDDAAILHATRTRLTRAPHVNVRFLRRFDDRLAAHLDGLAVAGDDAWALCEAGLESPHASAVFVAAIRAIQDPHAGKLDRLIALVQAVPECAPGLISAFGWLDREHLRGVVAKLLGATDPARRVLGIAASALHRIDPGLIAARRLEDADAAARARALRTAGELGKRELVSMLAGAILDEDSACRFWAARSAVLLGDRQNALEQLKAVALQEGAQQARALQLALQAMPMAAAHGMLQQFARDPAKARTLLQGAGCVGDPAYIPWLIGHMTGDKLARLAGEAFSMITGVDLAELDLERDPPEAIGAGPNDDPDDGNVDMDADEDLPWPDGTRVQAWWTQHGARFTQGVRHFVGAPVSRNHCVDVLKNGYQRQRVAAAYHLCLQNPGTPLFEWRAPAWRQQHELARIA
jgi:uncharacterized protein (TIGR02270 family)